MTWNLAALLAHLQAHPDFLALQRDISAGETTGYISVLDSARPYTIAALADALQRPLVILTPYSDRARHLADEIRQWAMAPEMVHLFAEPDAGPYERIFWSWETRQQRLSTLLALNERQAPGRPLIVVASLAALRQKTIPSQAIARHMRTLRPGQSLNIEKFTRLLSEIGYEAAGLVDRPGLFSRRGGILDLYPPHMTWPLRVDLFGDEIDTLRLFDPATQRTLPDREFAYPQRVTVGPAREVLPRYAQRACQRLRTLDLSNCHAALRQQMEEEITALCDGLSMRNAEFYLPYVYDRPASLLNHLPANSLLLLEDFAAWGNVAAELERHAQQSRDDLLSEGELPGNAVSPCFSAETLTAQLSARPSLQLIAPTAEESTNGKLYLQRTFTLSPHFGGQTRPFVTAVRELQNQGERVAIASREVLFLGDLFARHDVPISTEEIDRPLLAGEIRLQRVILPAGWALRLPNKRDKEQHLWLFSDAEIFGWRKPARRHRRVKAISSKETFFTNVKEGDYVVHIEHGIGIFQGLVTENIDGVPREYLKVNYAQGDTLLVPVQQADRLARYVGPAQSQPILHRLGTSDWEQAKRRARRAIADIAQELLALYAARATATGYAFAPDTPWQMELEASFPYGDTEDQFTATLEVKRDMEKPRPMDRLICGDVGYGKTEIAVRAAFKAIMDGKQVAILVPTTVLAQQHYNTFVRRFAPFPVRVEMLSRFLSPAAQRK